MLWVLIIISGSPAQRFEEGHYPTERACHQRIHELAKDYPLFTTFECKEWQLVTGRAAGVHTTAPVHYTMSMRP